MTHAGKAAAPRPPGRLSRLARSFRLRAAIAAGVLALSGGADAAPVVYVSRDGSDACPLSSSGPCATIGRALMLVDPGGTIVVLDMVRFNGWTVIAKAVSIVGPGPELPIMAGDPKNSLGAGILVAAPEGSLVEISRFRIEGAGRATWGVIVASAGEVHISNCFIRNVRGSGGAGIEVKPTTSSTRVFVSNCTITQNRNGVIVDPLAPATASVFLDSLVVDKNAGAGIQAGPGATIRLNNSTVTNNFVGLQAVKGGRLISFGNNAVAGNTTDGFPTETIDLR